MEQLKKYTDVVRLGHPSTRDTLQPGDWIYITEKVDGSNMSFIVDHNSPFGVTGFSRNNTLTEELTLNGAYSWLNNNIAPITDKLNPNIRYYGEWLTKHTIQYPEKMYRNFYLFDLYDETQQKYLSTTEVTRCAKQFGFKQAPVFYEGPYISFEHLMSFVGKTELGAIPCGEGIVVKNTTFLDRCGRQQFVKLVCDKMQEVGKQRPPKEPVPPSEAALMMQEVVTEARVAKTLHKLIDEGTLTTDDVNIENMGNLIKLVRQPLLDDIYKEESYRFENLEPNDVIQSYTLPRPSLL